MRCEKTRANRVEHGNAHQARSSTGLGPEDNAPHILIVDDDSRIRDLLARYLHDHGFRVTVAIDAESARAHMRSLAFDLIVLDVMMPKESGIDFAKSLRVDNQIPILMLTARAEPEHRIEGLETGVDDYLAKPFDPRELLLRIGNILKRGAASRTVGRNSHGQFHLSYQPRRAPARWRNRAPD